MVIGLGFEPRTDSLEGYCSIQLSYPTIHGYKGCLLPYNPPSCHERHRIELRHKDSLNIFTFPHIPQSKHVRHVAPTPYPPILSGMISWVGLAGLTNRMSGR